MNIKQIFAVAAVAAAMISGAAERPILREKLIPEKEYQFLTIGKLPMDFNRLPEEDSFVTYKRDAENLYINVKMIDADPVNESSGDQQVLIRTGDALQIFIKTENDNRIWEVMTDVNNNKSCFFHWGPGRVFYTAPDVPPAVKITAKSVKTAAGWESNITFPLAEVAKANKFPADVQFQVMVLRYNVGKNLITKDISCFPQALKNEIDPVRYAQLFPAGK